MNVRPGAVRWASRLHTAVLLVAASALAACTAQRTRILDTLVERPGGLHLEFTVVHAGAMAELGMSAAGRFRAELLSVQDDGLLVFVAADGASVPAFARSRLALIPWDVVGPWTVAMVPSDGGDQRVPLTLADERDMEVLRGWSRYPGPLDSARVERIRAAYDVPHVVRVGGGDEVEGHPAGHGVTPGASPGGEPMDGAGAAFIERVRAAGERFRDRGAAIREGYRRLGPDFPGMGEHWVHLGRAAAGVVDPERPALLTYVMVEGQPVLTGAAFVAPLRPGERPPPTPFGPEVWHDHSESVDEEALLLHSPGTHQDPQSDEGRVAMFHVWAWAENPQGIVAQNNWALPYLRVGLAVPEPLDPAAARGLSVVGAGADYYRALFTRATGAEGPDARLVEGAVARTAQEVAALLASAGASGTPAAHEFAALWHGLWDAMERGLSAGPRARLEAVAQDWRD